MKTVAYYLEPNADLSLALNIIVEAIPCFLRSVPAEEDEGFLYVEIKCRAEDARFVEEMLAPFA